MSNNSKSTFMKTSIFKYTTIIVESLTPIDEPSDSPSHHISSFMMLFIIDVLTLMDTFEVQSTSFPFLLQIHDEFNSILAVKLEGEHSFILRDKDFVGAGIALADIDESLG